MPDTLEVAGYDPYRDAAGYSFKEERAERAIQFFEEGLVHVKGSWRGKPLILERDWQRAAVANLYGWIDDATGYRRYQKGLLYIPRKNSKTTMAAGLGLTNFFLWPDGGGEIYSAARDGNQAAILYDLAREMVEMGPLEGHATLYKRHMRRRSDEYGLLRFEAINGAARSKHGLNASVFFADETHAWPSRELFDTVETSMGAREEPLVLSLTTAGEEGPSLCNQQLEYAKAVRDGDVLDPRYLPLIWEAPADADWTDPAVWEAANPNYGLSPREDYLASKCRDAQRDPTFEPVFRRLHLNQQARSERVWLDRRRWDGCARITPEELRGEPCYLGADLARSEDLCSIAAWFPRVRALQWLHFVPRQRAVEREVRGELPSYFEFAKLGELDLIESRAIRYDWVFERMEKWCRLWDVEAIALDPWNATDFGTRCEDAGLQTEYIRQGYSLSPPSKELFRLVELEELAHAHTKIMRWQVGNCVARRDHNDNIKPDKERSKEKIDGLAAAVNAMALGEVEEYDREEFTAL